MKESSGFWTILGSTFSAAVLLSLLHDLEAVEIPGIKSGAGCGVLLVLSLAMLASWALSGYQGRKDWAPADDGEDEARQLQ